MLKVTFAIITYCLTSICVDSSVHAQSIKDYDFQIIKNYILSNEETKEEREPSESCSYFSLESSELELRLELYSNCKGWNAIRITSLNKNVNVHDYFLNQEYQNANGGINSSVILTSSFGHKTDTACFRNLQETLLKIKPLYSNQLKPQN